VTYLRFSDDQHDFFSLNVNGPALVQVTVLSHTVSGAQAQVRLPLKPGFVCPGNGDDPVNSTDRIGAFGVVPSGGGNTQFVVDLPPGNAQYYIRVSLPSAGNGQPYYLRWEFISANGAPATRDPVFNSNPNQPYLPPYNGDTLTNMPPEGRRSTTGRGCRACGHTTRSKYKSTAPTRWTVAQPAIQRQPSPTPSPTPGLRWGRCRAADGPSSST
jgi:hypothetical protein